MPDAPPPDQAERERVVDDLGATLFVEAGAGSGKTTALVQRIVNLVLSGVELRAIAAITFTEKAGAELRDRLRQAIEGQLLDEPHPDRAERCTAALDQLDGAAIGTLHAFAQRLLSEHPIEAGLPPRVEVLDEVSSGVAFERRWAVAQDALLADPAYERAILLLLAAGVRTEAFRALARAFDQSWDLVAERVPDHVDDPPPVAELLAPVVDELRRLCDLRSACIDATDKVSVRLDEWAEFLDGIEPLSEIDEIDLLDRLVQRPGYKIGNIGRKACWNGLLPDIKIDLPKAGERLDEVAGRVAEGCAHMIGSAIRRFTLDAARQRQEAGQLEFHDLLVLARALLRSEAHGADVRATLHQRYQRVLLDEFQDTDPIQIDIAVRIAAAEPRSPEAGRAPWPEVAVAPGHLFVVGDPKQSIYRFRRADIALFIEARNHFGAANGLASLTANFRTVAPVIDWVNHTFAALMSEPPDEELALVSQPDYVPLAAVRDAAGLGPAVAVIGRDAHPARTKAPMVREAEAQDVAATIAAAIADGWAVADDTADGGWRPARLGDVCVLVPARTSLPFLDEALTDAGIPYRAESSSIVYATRAIRDLLMVARAIDDPTDQLRLVAALRTPLFGCGDDDLARFKVTHGGRFHLRDQPESVPPDDPVAVALAYLRARADDRRWLAPSELLDRIARDRRALELGFAEGRPRDVWRRHRFVIDQARAWHEATGGGLREYLGWVGQQTAEGARVAESVLPETDDDAVRVMTIHAAKGLEFPITIVSGLSSVPGGKRAPAEVRFPADGKVAYRMGTKVVTPEFADTIPIDEQMGLDERIRLLYVATTRARDHLVVSLHRIEHASAPSSARRTNAELLVAGMGTDRLAALPDAAPAMRAPVTPIATTRPAETLPFLEWQAARAAALAASSRRTTTSATALTDEGHADTGEPDPGLQKRPRDLDLPPWLKGRYGTSVGRAVHGVLQTIDLGSGLGIDDAVAAQCEAEAIPDRAATVRQLVEQALASDVVREASAAPHWREVYACTPLEGGRLLEGYVDLLYRTLGGLVVVDYKTAGSSDATVLDERVAGYRLQGASYALVVSAATAEPVHRVVFLFLTPDGAVTRELSGLDGAMADVRRLVVAGEAFEVAE
jgi:ATP-dependent exoDNAse (exonuclease V) beta subunit